MSARSRALVLAAWVSVVFPSARATATVAVPVSVEEMAQEARAVVLARVTSRESRWDEAHRRIHTFTELEVIERWAGAAPPRVVVRTLGGQVDGIGMKVSGVARFQDDEEVVVFLAADPLDSSRFRVIGMSQGKLRVDRQGPEPMAVPSTEGLVFAVRGASGAFRVDPAAPRLEPVTLSALRARVVQARGTAEPVSPVPSTPSPPLTPAPEPPALDPASPPGSPRDDVRSPRTTPGE